MSQSPQCPHVPSWSYHYSVPQTVHFSILFLKCIHIPGCPSQKCGGMTTGYHLSCDHHYGPPLVWLSLVVSPSSIRRYRTSHSAPGLSWLSHFSVPRGLWLSPKETLYHLKLLETTLLAYDNDFTFSSGFSRFDFIPDTSYRIVHVSSASLGSAFLRYRKEALRRNKMLGSTA